MTADLQPDLEFTRHLEWQLRTELRRRARFGAGEPSARKGEGRTWIRALRVSVLVLVSLLVGGAGAVAAEHYQGRERRQLNEARASLQLVLAQRREEVAATNLERIERLSELGRQNQGSVEQARSRHTAAGHAVERRALDLAEVHASGSEPRNDLSAPLIGGQDFVRLRLDLDRAETAAALAMGQQSHERVQKLVETGRIGGDEASRLEAEVGNSTRALEMYDALIALRSRFVRGELTAREVDLRGAQARAASARAQAQRELVAERAVLARLEALLEAGRVGGQDVEASRLRVGELEGTVLLADLELEILAGELAR